MVCRISIPLEHRQNDRVGLKTGGKAELNMIARAYGLCDAGLNRVATVLCHWFATLAANDRLAAFVRVRLCTANRASCAEHASSDQEWLA